MTGRIPLVGLTGAIAAGKSEALAALARAGAATISSDAIVHELLDSDELRDELVCRYGSQVAPDGAVDRSALAEGVFAEPEGRAWLEGRLWPQVGERIASWYAELDRAQAPPSAAVVEVPLLFEAGMEDAFDATLAVVADDAVRAQRAAARGHAGLESRSERQLSQADKAQRADHVVHNDGGIEGLEQKMSDLLATIRGPA